MAAVVIVVVMILVALLFATHGLNNAKAGAGKTAPSFSGSTLAGQTVSLDQYRGKPLLVVYMTDT
jgi:hypothetical protein